MSTMERDTSTYLDLTDSILLALPYGKHTYSFVARDLRTSFLVSVVISLPSD